MASDTPESLFVAARWQPGPLLAVAVLSERVGAFVALAGRAPDIAPGFTVGMTPAVGHVFGVPLVVRHVALDSGS